jgi:hypothetical protein
MPFQIMKTYGALVGLALGVSFSFAQNPAAAAPAAASGASPIMSQTQIQGLIRHAADKDQENDKKLRDYTYVQREDEHKLDGDGAVKSSETRTYEIMVLYGEQVRKQIEKDDKPLPEKDAAKEEEKIQKIIDKRKDESDDDRRKRLEKAEKEREDGRQFVKEVADAYDFQYVRTENLEGRETDVIDAEPHPGYEPRLKDAKFLPKFRFRVWIDKVEGQWVKLDIQCIDTVSVGLFLVRVHKGSNIQIELNRINEEVWLPKHIALKLDARIALFKGLNLAEDVTYRDYKKFRIGTRIVPLGEVEEKPH